MTVQVRNIHRFFWMDWKREMSRRLFFFWAKTWRRIRNWCRGCRRKDIFWEIIRIITYSSTRSRRLQPGRRYSKQTMRSMRWQESIRNTCVLLMVPGRKTWSSASKCCPYSGILTHLTGKARMWMRSSRQQEKNLRMVRSSLCTTNIRPAWRQPFSLSTGWKKKVMSLWQ